METANSDNKIAILKGYSSKTRYIMIQAYLALILYSVLTLVNFYTSARYLWPLREKQFHTLMLILMQVSYFMLIFMYASAIFFHVYFTDNFPHATDSDFTAATIFYERYQD